MQSQYQIFNFMNKKSIINQIYKKYQVEWDGQITIGWLNKIKFQLKQHKIKIRQQQNYINLIKLNHLK